jgi:hypothetical protein
VHGEEPQPARGGPAFTKHGGSRPGWSINSPGTCDPICELPVRV